MEDALWRMPARLSRQLPKDGTSTQIAEQTEIAHGSLHEMVRLATATDTAEGLMLRIDCAGAHGPYLWDDILALSRQTTFPVDI